MNTKITYFVSTFLLFWASMTVNAQAKLGDNPTDVNPNVLLELESSDKGLLIPRLTDAQRDSAFTSNVPEGLLIYNTTADCLQLFSNNSWNCIGGTTGALTLTGNILSLNNSSVDLSDLLSNEALSLDAGDATTSVIQLGSSSITLKEGSNITLTENGNTITIAAAAGGGGGGGATGPQGPPGPAGPQGIPGPAATNTDSQTLSLSGTTLSISGGNSVTLTSLSSATLVKVTENTNTGYRLIDAVEAHHGDIGDWAVDISYSGTATDYYGATGDHALAAGYETLASGERSVAMGVYATATGTTAFSFGERTKASALTAFATGYHTTASGWGAFSAGQGSTASGDSSIAMGNSTQASGEQSTAMGNATIATGDASMATGYSTTAPSFGEAVLGVYNTTYTAVSTNTWESNDRLFVVGNGTSHFNRSDAMVTLKNGNTGLGVSSPTATLHVSGTLRFMDGSEGLNKVLTSDANGNASWGTVSGGTSTPTVLADADGDTSINVEKTADIDQISYTVSGTEYFLMKEGRIDVLNTGGGVFIGENAGAMLSLPINNTSIAIGNNALGKTTAGTNIAVGDGALAENLIGSNNIAIGSTALENNTAGSNVAIGNVALRMNTTGSSNVAIGASALPFSENGSFNVANGATALNNNRSGSENGAIGYQTLHQNWAGRRGIAIGANAQQYANNTTTAWTNTNISIGYESLRGSTTPANNTGTNNIALGYQSMILNSSGSDNVGVGHAVLGANTTGDNNSAYGTRALGFNTIGYENVAIGHSALYNNKAGSRGTALGSYSQFNVNNTSTAWMNTNVSVGYSSLYLNSTGLYNTVVGYESMLNNSSGSANTAIGYRTLYSNTGGIDNLAAGRFSLYYNETGSGNVALGDGTLSNNRSGLRNTAVGDNALSGTSVINSNTGSYNVAVGSDALSNITSGTYNTAIGADTGGGLLSGSKNTIIGANVNGLSSTLSNTVILADGDGNRRIVVDANGNVGINSNNFTHAHTLTVNGSIGQEGAAALHPDYVFESYFEGSSAYNKEYSLPSLKEIETFVRENKHLPGVQSRADVEKSGSWNISENVRTNLEKVEEL